MIEQLLLIIAIFFVLDVCIQIPIFIYNIVKKRKVDKSHEPEDEDIGRTE